MYKQYWNTQGLDVLSPFINLDTANTQLFRDKTQMSSEYIIEPIQGMEAIQKNFADLSNNGNEAAKNLVESKKVLKP